MSAQSNIEWTDATWNPVTGCTQVGPGCDNCYAMRFAERWRGVPNHPYEQGFDLKLWPDRLEMPLSWKKPRLIFVNSMSDLFHKDIPESYIESIFEVMNRADWHIFQVLTKRSSRMASMANKLKWTSNIWAGVSVETDRMTNRVDHLRKVPANVRFISAEPLLGSLPSLNLTDIHWVITGGESGPGARYCDHDWVRAIRDKCLAEDVSFFHKQWGGIRPKSGGRTLDDRTWDDMPATLDRKRNVVEMTML
jgi:protein gp37